MEIKFKKNRLILYFNFDKNVYTSLNDDFNFKLSKKNSLNDKLKFYF